jgi:hypothetical protein
MLDECDQELWIFCGDARITRPLASVIRRNPEGIAYLAPEIQLLYKGRATRAQDQADFDHVAPQLARDARTCLLESLKTMDPDHAWIPTDLCPLLRGLALALVLFEDARVISVVLRLS